MAGREPAEDRAAGAGAAQAGARQDSGRHDGASDETAFKSLANYDRYFETITESAVLSGPPGGVRRIRLRAYSCALFFCSTLTMVKDVAEQAPGEILAHIDPRRSDFSEATEVWRTIEDGDQTRLQYDAELVPNCFVPPLLGPWLIERHMRASLLSGARTLEALAGGEP